MDRGLFLTVEGIEGAGKSSNLAFVEEYLIAAGKSVVVSREPGVPNSEKPCEACCSATAMTEWPMMPSCC